MADPVRILFLCVHNACRSQMAEGWAKALKPGVIEAYSAGSEPLRVDPMAIATMAEAGVDISDQYSKSVSEFLGQDFDYAITLCDAEGEACPYIPGVKMIHHPFDDPPVLAARARTREEALAVYRRVRDQVRDYVATLPETLQLRPTLDS